MTTYGGEQRPQGLSSTLRRQHEVPADEHRDRHAGCQRDEDAAERVARRQVSSTALLVFCARVERSVLVVRRPPLADWRDPLRKAHVHGPSRRILPAGRRLGCPCPTAAT